MMFSIQARIVGRRLIRLRSRYKVAKLKFFSQLMKLGEKCGIHTRGRDPAQQGTLAIKLQRNMFLLEDRVAECCIKYNAWRVSVDAEDPQPTSGAIQVYLRYPGVPSMRFMVDPKGPVLQLMEAVTQSLKVPIHDQVLFHGGKCLRWERTFQDYLIGSGDTIGLNLAIRGGTLCSSHPSKPGESKVVKQDL